MGKKDITEKLLASYNDVFADIVNVLLFNGKRIIQETDLEAESSRGTYKFLSDIHEQERDVAKFWKNNHVRIALCGVENQTNPDADMPLRILSYDGASYRGQLIKKKGKKAPTGEESGKDTFRYPVVTLVLYFGEDHWNQPRSLLERLSIPEELKPYVSDYRINVFEIAWLSDEQVQMFQSDFKFVADYFVQVRKNKDYIPSKETITHVQEVLQLMAALTNDRRFEEVQSETEKGERQTMCEILDKVEARGEARGISIGEARGISIGEARGISIGEARGKAIGQESAYVTILNNMLKSGMSFETAVKLADIPADKLDEYRRKLSIL